MHFLARAHFEFAQTHAQADFNSRALYRYGTCLRCALRVLCRTYSVFVRIVSYLLTPTRPPSPRVARSACTLCAPRRTLTRRRRTSCSMPPWRRSTPSRRRGDVAGRRDQDRGAAAGCAKQHVYKYRSTLSFSLFRFFFSARTGCGTTSKFPGWCAATRRRVLVL